MCDLKTQYQRLKSEIDAAMQEVLLSTQFIKGPGIKTFEENLAAYLGVKHVIASANGTDALQVAFMALRLQPGDEVITPAFTYAATVEVIKLLHLVPVYVDVDPNTYNIDVAAMEKAISAKTKAIVPVHLYGQCANMEAIMKVAQAHKLFVVEDNAQAIGADFIFSDGRKQKAGTIAQVGTTSFFPAKNLGCYGDGGAMFTNDDELAILLRKIANHGQGMLYSFEEIGVNSRLDSLQAAVLDVKLKYLDEFAAARNSVASYYDRAFAGMPNVQVPARTEYSSHVFHQYTLKLTGVNRDAVKTKLAERGIPSMVYYPKPMHIQPAYRDARFVQGMFPVSEQLCEQVLSLPIHTEMDEEQMQFIAENFVSIINELK